MPQVKDLMADLHRLFAHHLTAVIEHGIIWCIVARDRLFVLQAPNSATILQVRTNAGSDGVLALDGHMNRFLAVDLGAESGRLMVVELTDRDIALDEIHRFSNGPIRVLGGLFWDPLCLFGDLMLLRQSYHKERGP
jgi:hypothetical protein